MSGSLLLRGLPSAVKDWIAEESHGRRVSQNQFVQEVLQKAHALAEPLPLLEQLGAPPRPTQPVGLPFRFIDLFAGIGGMRLGLEAVGGECVFSCEWDEQAQRTYKAWYGELPAGDINEPGLIESIQPHDVLAAGFPCQPFSIAGVSKKNSLGRVHGFEDATQGNLFFKIMETVDAHRPAVLLLENVKNLKSHDRGATWARIKHEIEVRDYQAFDTILDAAHWVPQHRERIFIVCFDRRVFGKSPAFAFTPPPSGPSPRLRDILEHEVNGRYTLSPALWQYLQDYAEGHKAKGNGFGFGMADLDGVTRTLSARYYKDGSEVLIPQGKRNPRKLSPREAARLMGFPDDKPIVVSDTQAYRQFGNAVVPAAVEWVARDIVKAMCAALRSQSSGTLLTPSKGKAQRKGRAA